MCECMTNGSLVRKSEAVQLLRIAGFRGTSQSVVLQTSSFLGWPFAGLKRSGRRDSIPDSRSAACASCTMQSERNAGASRSSGALGVDVFAPSQDTAEYGTLRLGSYNIGAQNFTFEGPQQFKFQTKCASDLYDLSTCADVLCIQEISGTWLTFMVEVLKWRTVCLDKKAFFWRPDVILETPRWRPLFPDNERQHRHGVFWAALCRHSRCTAWHGRAWCFCFRAPPFPRRAVSVAT